MKVIIPTTITEAMLGAGVTLSEDPTPVWAAGTYAVGDERHVVQTHRVYRCALSGTSSVRPDMDVDNRWKDMRPTNKWAPFDNYTSTQAESTTTDIVYPITARFANSVALYGVAGHRYEVTVRESVGGAVIATRTGRLQDPAVGWWDWLFGRRRTLSKVIITDLPIRPAAQITIAIRASGAVRRAVGMIVIGRIRPFIGRGAWGGSEFGASAEPYTYSYIDFDEDGQLTIVRKPSATNLRAKLILPRDQADNALAMLQEVLDVPVAFIVTQLPGYGGLSTFGLAAAAPVVYENDQQASIEFNIKGIT